MTNQLHFRSLSLFVLAFFALWAGAWAQNATTKVSNFRYPLDVDAETGKLNSILLAESAIVPQGGRGPVSITGLKIQMLKDDEAEMTVTSPGCVFDRRTNVATSREAVRIEREDALITGEGFAFNTQTKRFEIFSNVRVELLNLNRATQPAADEEADPSEPHEEE